MFKIPKRILNEIGLYPATTSKNKNKKKGPPSIIDCKTMGDEGGDGPQVIYQSISPKRSLKRSRSTERSRQRGCTETSINKSQRGQSSIAKSSSKMRSSNVNQTVMTTYEDSLPLSSLKSKP